MPVKLRNEARVLKGKAISSMRAAMFAFNSPHDDGRVTTVLLHLQHAFEMLLKAALVQNRTRVFDKESGRSIGFGRCLNVAQSALPSTPTAAPVRARAPDVFRNPRRQGTGSVARPSL